MREQKSRKLTGRQKGLRAMHRPSFCLHSFVLLFLLLSPHLVLASLISRWLRFFAFPSVHVRIFSLDGLALSVYNRSLDCDFILLFPFRPDTIACRTFSKTFSKSATQHRRQEIGEKVQTSNVCYVFDPRRILRLKRFAVLNVNAKTNFYVFCSNIGENRIDRKSVV